VASSGLGYDDCDFCGGHAWSEDRFAVAVGLARGEGARKAISGGGRFGCEARLEELAAGGAL